MIIDLKTGFASSGCRKHPYSGVARQVLPARPDFFRRAIFCDQNKAGAMTVEHAIAHSLLKPWGAMDSRPWSSAGGNDRTVGEIWYERSGPADVPPALLLKLLLTSQPLSIQVHPGDAYARSMGLPNGKTEAWYVLSATPEARIALGLKRRLTRQQLRQAIDDGSISDLVVWQAVRARRHRFRPGRNDPRDRRGSGDRGDPATQRRDVSSVRSRPRPRTSYRGRHRGRGCRPRQYSCHAIAADRQPDPSDFEQSLHV